jgi:hypothetical protein
MTHNPKNPPIDMTTLATRERYTLLLCGGGCGMGQLAMAATFVGMDDGAPLLRDELARFEWSLVDMMIKPDNSPRAFRTLVPMCPQCKGAQHG